MHSSLLGFPIIDDLQLNAKKCRWKFRLANGLEIGG